MSVLLSSTIGSLPQRMAVAGRMKLAALRALRTTIQAAAAAFPAAGVGMEILETAYWETLGYSMLTAVIAGVVSFLNNIASFLPEDPTQPTVVLERPLSPVPPQ